jgi:hypothetical protein
LSTSPGPQPVHGEEWLALGCVIVAADEGNETKAAEMFGRLSLRDFEDWRHRLIFESLLGLLKAGKPLQSPELDRSLRAHGPKGKASAAYAVQALNVVPFVGAFEGALEAVKEAAQRRDILNGFEAIRESIASGAMDLLDLPEHLRKAAENAAKDNAKTTSAPWRTLDELEALPLPTPPAVVDGLLRRGEVGVFGGGSKSFKSWLAMDLCLAVACGRSFLGRQTTQGRVLLVNLELPEWALRKRIRDIRHARSDKPASDALLPWTLRGQRATADGIRKAIASRPPDDLALVVVDPVYKLLQGRDENSAGDIGQLFETIAGIAADTGAALLLPAHFAKGNAAGKEAMDRVSGSGVFARFPDSLLTMTRHEEEDAFTLEAILRTFPPAPAAVVRWQHPVFSVDASLDPARLKQAAGGRPSKYDPDKLAGLLGKGPLSSSEWAERAKERFEIPRKTFTDYRDRLVDQGQVVKSSTSDTYYLPKK